MATIYPTLLQSVFFSDIHWNLIVTYSTDIEIIEIRIGSLLTSIDIEAKIQNRTNPTLSLVQGVRMNLTPCLVYIITFAFMTRHCACRPQVWQA